MTTQSSSSSTSSLQALQNLQTDIEGLEKVPIQTGWFGRKISYKGKEISEKALWKKFEEQITKVDASVETWTTAGLCERALEKLHDNIEKTPASRLQRFLDWVFGVRASPQEEKPFVIKAINTPINQNIEKKNQANRIFEFTKTYGNKFPELKNLIIEGLPKDEPKRQETIKQLAKTIASYNLRNIQSLFDTSEQLFFPQGIHLSPNQEKINFSTLLKSAIHKNLSPTFFTKLTDSFEGEDKSTLKALFEHAAQNSPIQILNQGAIVPPLPYASEKKLPEETLIEKFLTKENGTKIFEFLDFLKKNSSFDGIKPDGLNNPVSLLKFVSKMKSLLIPYLKVPLRPCPEDFFAKGSPEINLLFRLMNIPPPKEFYKPVENQLWKDVISIVNTLEKEGGLAGEIAAITILRTVMPPQMSSEKKTPDLIIDNIVPFVPAQYLKKTEFTKKLLLNRKEYSQFSDALLEKALTFSLLEDAGIGPFKEAENQGAATPFLLGIDKKTPEDATYFLCCVRDDGQRARQFYETSEKQRPIEFF